jgi:hypothetical protein
VYVVVIGDAGEDRGGGTRSSELFAELTYGRLCDPSGACDDALDQRPHGIVTWGLERSPCDYFGGVVLMSILL